jgi:hypothetical protein
MFYLKSKLEIMFYLLSKLEIMLYWVDVRTFVVSTKSIYANIKTLWLKEINDTTKVVSSNPILRRGVLDKTLCDKVGQWLAAGRWVSPGTLFTSGSNTDRQDIAEILLKVHRPVVSNWQASSHNVVHLALIEIRTHAIKQTNKQNKQT